MEQRSKHIETLLVIATGMTILFLVMGHMAFLYVALSVAVVGLISPMAAKYIHLGWMGLAKVLGYVNSHIILGLVFYLILTPLALIRRLGKKDLLQLRKRADRSYFTERNHQYTGKDLENPW